MPIDQNDISNILNNWIKNPEEELDFGYTIIENKNELQIVFEALNVLKDQIINNWNYTTYSNLHNLCVLLQYVENDEVLDEIKINGIPILGQILDLVNLKDDLKESKMILLKIISIYFHKNTFLKLIECVKSEIESEDIVWGVIFNNIFQDKNKYDLIIKELNGFIPKGFLGISYLNMCNNITFHLHEKDFKHSFNSEIGFDFLNNLIQNNNSNHITSIITSIPFLKTEYQEKLIEKVSEFDNFDIRLELVWAKIKLNDKNAIEELANFAKDYRYSAKAVNYLKELDLYDLIPNEIHDKDFQALAEMCLWLSDPCEFGKNPDYAEIIDKRTLFWPPTKDTREMFVIRYTYYKFNSDNSDYVGFGVYGSLIFNYHDINLLSMKPLEILAIQCAWEMDLDFEFSKEGMDLLLKYNSILR